MTIEDLDWTMHEVLPQYTYWVYELQLEESDSRFKSLKSMLEYHDGRYTTLKATDGYFYRGVLTEYEYEWHLADTYNISVTLVACTTRRFKEAWEAEDDPDVRALMGLLQGGK